MPVTEFIFPAVKPDNTQEVIQVIKKNTGLFEQAPGLLYNRLGHLLRKNGEDIANDDQIALSIEWDRFDSFVGFTKTSEFEEFIAQVKPHVTAPAAPKVFEPADGYESSKKALQSGITQVIRGSLGLGKREAVEGALATLATALMKEPIDVATWSGYGLGAAEGKWIVILGWEGVAKFDEVSNKKTVAAALTGLKGLEEVDEFVIRFEA